jgi:hypothetical protein
MITDYIKQISPEGYQCPEETDNMVGGTKYKNAKRTKKSKKRKSRKSKKRKSKKSKS